MFHRIRHWRPFKLGKKVTPKHGALLFDFRNRIDTPIVVWLEPWAEEIEIKPGSTLLLMIHCDAIDTLEAEQTDKFLVIWLWRGCRVQAFVDGEDRTSAFMSTPAPV